MNTLDSLLANIDANPTDILLWGILADYFEDNSDERSVGMRWLITEGKTPINRVIRFSWRKPQEKKGFPWRIPSKVWDKLEAEPVRGWNNCKDFPTLSSALLAAAEAYSLFLKDSENVSLEHTTSG